MVWLLFKLISWCSNLPAIVDYYLSFRTSWKRMDFRLTWYKLKENYSLELVRVHIDYYYSIMQRAFPLCHLETLHYPSLHIVFLAEIPNNEYIQYFAPDYTLKIRNGNMVNPLVSCLCITLLCVICSISTIVMGLGGPGIIFTFITSQ